MKRSFVVTALILAIVAWLGWRSSSQLASARERNSRLKADAASLGITPDPANPLVKMAVDRQRENHSSLTAPEYIAFIKEMEAKRKQGRQSSLSDEEAMKRVMAMGDRLSALDAGELKRLIAELRSSPELGEETRDNAIMMALMTLAERHPQGALAAFTGSDELLPMKTSMRRQFISSALGKWAQDDPLGAVKWIQQYHDKYADVIIDEVKDPVITSIAARDPKLAFQLLGDLKFQDGKDAISTIVNAAKTPAERTATLQALREHAMSLQDTRARDRFLEAGLSSLADHVARGEFEQGVQWIDSAKLSATERQNLGKNISAYNIQASETGQWVEWVGKNLPESETTWGQIATMLDNWTQKDYIAAGKWLTTAPDGPAKQAAVFGYVQAVASYEPETAAQWAMTISSAEERTLALRQIYQNWPKNDPAAKAAAESFADKHGIKR